MPGWDGTRRAFSAPGVATLRRLLLGVVRRARGKAGAAGRLAPARHGQRGVVDGCTTAYVRGWAVDGNNRPAPLSISADGRVVAELVPNLQRDDLETTGIAGNAGFWHWFAQPLSPRSTVAVSFADGATLERCPCTPGAVPERLERLLAGVNPQLGTGLEIGPLDRPLLSKAWANVYYVDHADRAGLVRKYEGHPVESVDPARIVAVDFVWPGGELAAVLPAGLTFDFCVASHVIEHVGDPVGWLASVAAVLKPGGRICLAIPEQTLTFDYRRALSKPADLIDAYVRRLQRPGPGQVFDSLAYTSPIERKGEHPPPPDDDRLRLALDAARSAEGGTYHDVHCHVFTRPSFLESWDVIARLNLLPLAVAESFEPLPGANEFVVILRKTPG
jgi:SAM-dependent methyltransferase